MLSEKKKAFCKQYVLDFNGSAAAIRAGYSKNRARITASEFLADDLIQKEVASLIKARQIKNNVTVEKVIEELAAIGFAKTTDFINVKEVETRKGRSRKKEVIVHVELTDNIDPEKLRAIAEISQTKDGVRLKLHDKVKALELLGKHVGAFEADNSQSRPVVFSNKVIFK